MAQTDEQLMGMSKDLGERFRRGNAERKVREHKIGKLILCMGLLQGIVAAVLLILFNLPAISLNGFLVGNLIMGMFATIFGAIMMDVNKPVRGW